MLLRRINNLILILIILLSTGMYEIAALKGSYQKFSELIGAGIIVFLLLLYIIYSNQERIRQNFAFPIALILMSVVFSMFMAKYSRDQSFSNTLFAQRGMYYYLLYFLLHRLKILPGDLQKILVGFGIIYILLFLLQFFAYPKYLFNTYINASRGTIRIYLNGSVYLSIAILFSIQQFFRLNKTKYLILFLGCVIIIILTGGRQTMAIMAFVMVLFLIIDRRVKSKVFLALLGAIGTTMLYFIFQDIFEALIYRSQIDASKGENYIRILAIKFYLTDFNKNALSYFTGNGMYQGHSRYGMEVMSYNNIGYYFGDVGIIGNYVIYGFLFLIGVIIIIVKSFQLRIEPQFRYIKYLFFVTVLGLMTAGSFAQGHFIAGVTCILYLIDVSNTSTNQTLTEINIQQKNQ